MTARSRQSDHPEEALLRVCATLSTLTGRTWSLEEGRDWAYRVGGPLATALLAAAPSPTPEPESSCSTETPRTDGLGPSGL